MTQSGFQLAQVNIGRARGETTDPVMAEFMARLPEINALAEASPGFVWRLQTEDGDATAVRPYADARVLINLSAGHRPSVAEAVARLARLEEHGPTAHAFGFATPFGPDGQAAPRAGLTQDDACPAG